MVTRARSKFYVLPPELATEARKSLAELDRGEAADLTPDDLEHWRKTGRLPERVMRWAPSRG